MKLETVRNAILGRLSSEHELATADPSGLTHEFLARMYDHLRAHVKDGELSEDDFRAAVRHARGHAGGKRRAMNAEQLAAMQAEMTELVADVYETADDEDQYGSDLTFSAPVVAAAVLEEDGSPPVTSSSTETSPTVELHEFAWGVEFGEGAPIQIMRTGTFQHPEYGEFSITPKDIQEIATNFRKNTRGQDIPVDIDHDHKGGAVGWIKGLTVKDSGNRLDAVVDWTNEGEQLVGSGKFKYFSPHFGPWADPETKEQHRVVLMSGALTNLPFLKHMEPLALSEFAVRQKEDRPMAMELAEMQKMLEETQRELAETKAVEVAREKELAEAKAGQEKTLAEATEREKALTDRIGLIERDARVKRLSDLVHGNGNPNARWVGEQDAQITFLMSLAETFGEDSPQFGHYVSEQNANAARIRESGLLSEVGSSGGGAPSTVMAEVETKLNEMTAGGKPRHEALIELMKREPALYQRYSRETAPSGRGD